MKNPAKKACKSIAIVGILASIGHERAGIHLMSKREEKMTTDLACAMDITSTRGGVRVKIRNNASSQVPEVSREIKTRI